jgi:hypothetical protein
MTVADLPPASLQYLPVLAAEVCAHWPTAPLPYLAAQVEQETCYSKTHRKCWNPRAELKTQREYGFGLGQLTVTERFNTFEDVQKLDTSLRGWGWAERYDPRMQLRALVVLDRQHFRNLPQGVLHTEKLPMFLSAYNGGMGGLLNDRRLCAATPPCDPNRWWGNVERTSFKAKVKVTGYGKSFYEINREYVSNIVFHRVPAYKEYFSGLKYSVGKESCAIP